MRTVAGVLASVGLILAAWLALDPISVEAPNADGRCGAPVIRVWAQETVDDVNEQAIIDRCEDVAWDQVALAGLCVGTGLVAFVLARIAVRRRAAVLRHRRDVERHAAAVRAEDDHLGVRPPSGHVGVRPPRVD